MAVVMTIGTTMENIGWAVINNLHILFAVAIGGGWAKERAGGAFAAVLAFALINVITGNIFGVYQCHAGRFQCCDPYAVRTGDCCQWLLHFRTRCPGSEYGRIRGHHRRFCGAVWHTISTITSVSCRMHWHSLTENVSYL